MNEDAYLAEFVPTTGGESVLLRLVDEYPNAMALIFEDGRRLQTGTSLRIRRDELCDLPFAGMPLRTAPGDPMAILPVRLNYKPKLANSPPPDEILPCYRPVRLK